VLCLAAIGWIAAPAANAEECEGWLPDFQDCERETRFEGFGAPMSHPFYFEDPFITTSLSLWGIWHEFPESSVFQGGDAIAYAAQIRVALTDRLALIATKDGRYQLRPDNNLLDTEKGYGDWGLGLKYALLKSKENEPRYIVSPSLRYETTNGDEDVLNGNGEGVWIPAVSAALEAGPLQLTTAVGARLPVDGDAESQIVFYYLHLDHPVTDWLIPFVEFSGLSYVDEGDGSNPIKLFNGTRLPVDTVQSVLGVDPFEGYDVANVGSGRVEGDDVFAFAVGLRAKLTERLWLGLAYERPLTKRRHILKQRATMNLLYEY
jgi:hypothetical protein